MDSDDTCRRHCLDDVLCPDLHIVTTVHHGYHARLPHALSDLAGAGDVAERQVMGGGCVLLAACAGRWSWWAFVGVRERGAVVCGWGVVLRTVVVVGFYWARSSIGLVGRGDVAQRRCIIEVVGSGGD
jgi:hypothetical protein